MAVITRDQLKPFSMGHLGLAGAFIRETKIIEMIDFMIPKSSNIPDILLMVRLLL